MAQLEFKFFWPLTEQIPLDLDHSSCSNQLGKSRFYVSPGHEYCVTVGGAGPAGRGGTGSIVISNSTTIDAKEFYFKYVEEPPWYRKLLLKLIGLGWRK